MLRGHRLALGLLSLLGLSSIEAQAQYTYPYGAGYAGGGFGGFGGTVDGDIARGMGAFAAGAGTYNAQTAQANALNANTVMQINEYLYQSQLAANAREAQVLARRNAAINASQKAAVSSLDRARLNPTEADISSGAALNSILDQLSDPKILSGSTLRLANAKVPAKVIRDTPFRDATDAITITLSQLTDEKSWPAVLRDDKFDAERKAYIKAVADALEQDTEGDIPPATVRQVRQTISDLYKKVGETIPKTRQPDHLNAMNYLKGLAGFSRMLERSNVEQILSELEKIEDTSVGNLLAFMHSYNLRFGTAETVKQRAAYQTLYPTMVATRDKLIGKPEEAPVQAKGATPKAPGRAAQPAGGPGDIFHGIDPQYLHPSTPAAPARPGPATPAPVEAAPKPAGAPR